MINENILIIGLGSIGERYVRNLIYLGVKNIYVLRRKISKNSKPRTFDIKKINVIHNLTKENIHLFKYIIIANPTSMHKKYIEKFSKINVKILCEIPILKDTFLPKDIYNILIKKNKSFIAGFNFRFHPALKYIKKIIDSKKYGKVLYSRFIFGEKISNIHNWENFKNRYEVRKSLGGGVLRTSCHEIDMAYYLFGNIKKCTAIKKNLLFKIDCEDFININLEHQNKVISNITLDFLSPKYTRNSMIVFENMSLFWDFKKNTIKLSNGKNEKTKKILFDFNQTYIEQTKYFLKPNKKNTNASHFKDSYNIQKIIEKIDFAVTN